MDRIDREILAQLQGDGRLPNALLAERVHLSPSPCLRRLKRLERNGTIRGYRALLDRQKVGLGLTAFVELKVTAHSARAVEEIEEAVGRVDNIVAAYIVTGETDLLLEVVAPDLAGHEHAVLGILEELPGVADVNSSLVVRALKEPAALPLVP
jgi:Lrp/AsnC family leucine-responsive transcriptional regulator